MKLTPEILKERKTGIGGSDCAAVLGLSKWSTPLDIYLSKINPDSTPKLLNESMEWGIRHEPTIIEKCKEIFGKIHEPNYIFKNEKYPHMLANVDGIITDTGNILEVKTTKFFSEDWGNQRTDEIPQEYLIQCAHYCAVLERNIVEIAVLGAGSEFRLYRYERNENLEKQIIEKTAYFWNEYVLKQIPPPAINNDDIIKLYNQGDESKTLIADVDVLDLAYKHKQIKSQIKELKEQQDFVEMGIKAAMKDNAYLIDTDGTKLCSWKNQITTRFDTQTFKIANPELYKQFSKQTESRVLRNQIK